MNINCTQNKLILSFDKKVDYNLTAYYQEAIKFSTNGSFQFLELNFAKTKFITLPGSMYILLIVNKIITDKNKSGIFIHTMVTDYTENLVLALSNFGLLHMLEALGNLKLDEDSKFLSDKRINFWKKLVKKNDYDLHSLYWPISIIPMKNSHNFEEEVSNFFNNFFDYFNLLLKYELITELNFENFDFIQKYFIKAINESTKNVWDHSDSWGVSSIHANESNKTTFCLFDNGIGFLNSYIKRKGSFDRSVENDISVLKWLFQEGNTSNDGSNHGHGLAIITKFVDLTKGILIIKTDKYLMHYENKKGLNIMESSFFPGTQIMINF